MGNRHSCCTLISTFDYQNEDKKSKKFNPYENFLNDESDVITEGQGAGEDDWKEFEWDGPENSDEEIQEFINDRMAWEVSEGVRFSKNGFIQYIENKFYQEDPDKNFEWK